MRTSAFALASLFCSAPAGTRTPAGSASSRSGSFGHGRSLTRGGAGDDMVAVHTTEMAFVGLDDVSDRYKNFPR